jgi:endonuclease/exonuclease/phosphatase family metal-dependent hydrolase
MRNRRDLVVGVLLPIVCVAAACVSNAALVRDVVSAPCAAIDGRVEWLRIPAGDERQQSDRWCQAVGQPVIESRSRFQDGTNRLVVVSWNVHVGGGNILALVEDLRTGRLTGRPTRSFVLLLQEVYRSGLVVSAAPGARFASAVKPGGSNRVDITATARALDASLFYVPSMRNGPPSTSDEDRGNAILSTLPLAGYTAIELPLERQRRVVVTASTTGDAGTRRWRLRLVSAHFTNAVGHHFWVLSELGRVRHALALGAALDPNEPTLLGGDFNTWFGFQDAAYQLLARRFRNEAPGDRRPTFSIMRLDHVFHRLPAGWRVTVSRARQKYGSDHYPLIAELIIP